MSSLTTLKAAKEYAESVQSCVDYTDAMTAFLAGATHERERAKGLIEALDRIGREDLVCCESVESHFRCDTIARKAISQYRAETPGEKTE